MLRNELLEADVTFGLAFLLWSGGADAAECWFDGPPYAERSEAVAMSRSAREHGYDARVVRRSGDQGWEYLVRVEGLVCRSMTTPLQEFQALVGNDVEVWQLLEGQTEPERVPIIAKEEAPAESTEPAEPAEADRGSGADLAARAVAAHGGSAGGAAAIDEAESVLFRFRRTLPTGEVIDHTWANRSGDVLVKVEPVQGEVQASQTLVTTDGAWLAVAEGQWTAQDRERTVETLAAMSPRGVVPFVLLFPKMDTTQAELAEHTVEVDGTALQVFTLQDGETLGEVTVAVHPETSLVHRVEFPSSLALQFDEWAEQSGPVRLPKTVRTWRDGALADTIEVLELDLSSALPDEWFTAP